MNRQLLKIIENKNVAENHFLLTAEYPDGIKYLIPGQFFNIRISDTYDPLLRRPLSYCNANDGVINFFYKTIGKGTALLSQKKPGQLLDIIGPLGNGFKLDELEDNACMVAGGIGIAPLYPLAMKFEELNKKYFFIAGTKTEKQLVLRTEKIISVTEDGSSGNKGTACEEFEKLAGKEKLNTVYACGPKGMLIELVRICKKNRIKAYLCMETQMACGIGVCLGCVIPVKGKNQYKLTCKDGPVFDGEDIEFK